jgi:hypothetical protein
VSYVNPPTYSRPPQRSRSTQWSSLRPNKMVVSPSTQTCWRQNALTFFLKQTLFINSIAIAIFQLSSPLLLKVPRLGPDNPSIALEGNREGADCKTLPLDLRIGRKSQRQTKATPKSSSRSHDASSFSRTPDCTHTSFSRSK